MNELFLPRDILKNKETGEQFKVDLSSIDPWPTEPAEEEPTQPMIFKNTVTIKLSKEDSLAFKRKLRRLNKVPRKLKKALRHVGFFIGPMQRIETENGCSFEQNAWFGPKDGYPYTKWVNRACQKFKANAILIMESQLKEHLHQNP